MFSCEASRVDPSRRRDEIPIPSRQDNSPPRFHHLRLNSNCVEGLGNFPPIINEWESVHRGQGVRRGSAGSDARVGALRTRRRCEYVPSVLIHLCEAYDVSNPTRNPSTLSPPVPHSATSTENAPNSTPRAHPCQPAPRATRGSPPPSPSCGWRRMEGGGSDGSSNASAASLPCLLELPSSSSSSSSEDSGASPSPSSAAPSRAAGGRASTMASTEGRSPPSSSSSNPPAPMRSTMRRTSSRVCGDLAPRARGAFTRHREIGEIGTDPSGKSGNRRFFVTE